MIFAGSLAAISCGGGEQPGNSNVQGNNTANSNASAFTYYPAKFMVAEPERYSLLLQLGEREPQPPPAPAPTKPSPASKPSGDMPHRSRNSKPASTRTSELAAKIINPTPVLPRQFELDKLGADRRWSFQLEGLGSVVYLEKSGLKYLVLFDRKQYFEVGSAELGFDAGKLLNPVTAASQYAAHLQYEGLGSDEVAARSALRFRFAPAQDDGPANQVQCLISVDIETRLPVRFERNVSASSGAESKSLLEAQSLKLSPSRSMFDVPSGMIKIETEAARPQIQSFIDGVKVFIEALNPPQPKRTQAQPAGNSNVASNANKNSGANANKSSVTSASRNRRKAAGPK